MIRWRCSIDHGGKTTRSTADPSLLGLLNGPSPYAQTRRTIGPRGSTHDWASIREVERMIKRRNPSQTHPNKTKVKTITPHGKNALDRIPAKKVRKRRQTMTTRDPRNPEQEKVNRGRRRKTYQTKEESKRDDPKRDRKTKTTKSSLER